jgi:hypothetical protein
MEQSHTYKARLDFLYQSIAVYAVVLIVYLVVRSSAVTEAFPSFWQDPLLMLLSAIIVVSAVALGYNLFMSRQIEIAIDAIAFHSRARERRIAKSDLAYVQFGPRFRRDRSPIRVVRLRLRNRKRPIRIRLANFERRKQLLAELREWAGPLAREPRRLPGIGKEPAR